MRGFRVSRTKFVVQGQKPVSSSTSPLDAMNHSAMAMTAKQPKNELSQGFCKLSTLATDFHLGTPGPSSPRSEITSQSSHISKHDYQPSSQLQDPSSHDISLPTGFNSRLQVPPPDSLPTGHQHRAYRLARPQHAGIARRLMIQSPGSRNKEWRGTAFNVRLRRDKAAREPHVDVTDKEFGDHGFNVRERRAGFIIL